MYDGCAYSESKDIKSEPTLLTARKLLNPLLFVMFAVEADADTDTSVVLDGFSSLLVFRVVVALGRGSIGFPLNDKPSTTCRNQLRENTSECF